MAAADITLLALAMVTTTMRTVDSNGRTLLTPSEQPTEGYSAVTDLGDDRGLSATLNVRSDGTRPRPVLEVALETSADSNVWRELATFKRIEAADIGVTPDDTKLLAKQSISAAADRYVRVKYRVAQSALDSGMSTNGGVKFGVAARRT